MIQMIHVLLVDDHAMVRGGIRMILERQPDMQVVGEAATGADAVALAFQLQPTVVVLDVGLADMDGIEVLRRIKASAPQIRVIMITGARNEHHLRRALEAGALGYVLKEGRSTDLVRAIRAVARGELMVVWPADGASIEMLLQTASLRLQPPRHSVLTQRECQVLGLVATGYSNAAVGRQLGISPKTVESHRTHLMEKLDLHCRSDLTRYALEHGYLAGIARQPG
jgi:two-component system response regulator NreC